MCVCVRACVRAWMCIIICLCVCVCVCACACACVRACVRACVCVCVRQRNTCLAIVNDLLSHSENKWAQDKASCHITNLSLLHDGWPQTSSEYPHLNIIKLYCLQTVDEVGIKLELDAIGEPKRNGVRTNGRWCMCVWGGGGGGGREEGGRGTEGREREEEREPREARSATRLYRSAEVRLCQTGHLVAG